MFLIKRFHLAGLILLLACGLMPAARADVEVQDAGGRRILLKDDGTWRVIEGDGKSQADAGAADKPKVQADLQLLRKADLHGGCQLELALINGLPYAIQSFVPYFAAYRSNGVVYSTESVGFGPIKPGDRAQRTLRFTGIACADISKLQVQGGDRCEMGDLNRFSDAPGQCLDRVRVVPGDLLTFEK